MTLPSVTEPPEKPVEKSVRPAPKAGKRAADTADREMGAALRSIYQRTVDEAVPDDLMSILGRLD
jgi:hypothetical protein